MGNRAKLLGRAGAADTGLDRAALEHALGLDAPLLVQYGHWMEVVPQTDGNFSGIFKAT